MAREAWGSIRKLPSKNFQASYVWDGKRYNAPSTFATKSQARSWLARRHGELLSGTLPEPIKRGSDTQLDALFVKWLSERESEGGSPGTIRSYKSRWDAHIKSDLGKVQARHVTSDLVTKWEAGKTWKSPAVRRNALLLLSSFFNWCVKTGHITTKPTLTTGTLHKLPTRHEPTIVTPDQVQAIMNAMPEPLRIAVDLAAWCALRFGEIAALRRCDVNLDQGLVHVRASIKRGVGGVQTRGTVKTTAGRRTVVIPPKCLERLRDHMDTHVASGDDALVVHMLTSPDKWLTNNSLHRYFDPACAAAGLPGLRFHDLRHTGLTMAGRAGATLAELMHRAGHSDVGAVMIYQHADMERDRQLAAKMEG